MRRLLAVLLSLLIAAPAQAGWLYAPPTILLNQGNTWTKVQNFANGATVTSPLDVLYSSVLFDRLSVNSSGDLLIQATANAPGAATAALAGAGAGNVNNGTHSYKVTFVTAGGETNAGAVSNTVTVNDMTTNGKVSLSAIPTGSSFVTSRKVYRTATGNDVTGPWLLLTTIADNTTTTYTDNTADASLTTTVPSANTAIDTRFTLANSGLVTLPAGLTLSGGDLTFVTSSVLSLESANMLAIKNGTTAQTLKVYQTTTGPMYVGLFGNYSGGSPGLYSTGTLHIATDGNIFLWNRILPQVNNSIDVGEAINNAFRAIYLQTSINLSGINGQKMVYGRLTQLVSVGSGVSTQATTIQIPADAVIDAVPVYVVTKPGGTTTMTVTATTSGTAFQKGANISTTAGTSDPGSKGTPVNYNGVAAQTVTFTFNAATTDALGQIRVDLYYHVATPPTS